MNSEQIISCEYCTTDDVFLGTFSTVLGLYFLGCLEESEGC